MTHTVGHSGRARRLGVLGTLTRDTILRAGPEAQPVDGWGGISYSLGALEATLGPGWEIVPLLKVGHDLSGEALGFLADFPRLRTDWVVPVPESNNRVELRYTDEDRRTERLLGGVPGWSAAEIGRAVGTVDALYVNFISGFELDLAAARALREVFDGPVYADLHSLFLGIADDGTRFERDLPDASGWLSCFEGVQVNETEFELLGRSLWAGGPADAPDGSVEASATVLADAFAGGLRLLNVTLGTAGAAYLVTPDFDPDPFAWTGGPGEGEIGRVRRGAVETAAHPIGADPTGCGDVWGAACFARLLSGDALEDAMSTANRVAGLNARTSGADGLHVRLRESQYAGGHRQ